MGLGTAGGHNCVLCVIIVALVVVFPSTGQVVKPHIYSLRVFSDIKYHFATTLVTSRMLNPGTTAREAQFDVTLPNQAFISDFTLEIGGKIYPGKVKEKEVAQKEYDKAKQRGQSAGQVKQKPRETNRFKVEINVGPGESVTFNLTYQEVLERRLGVYELVVYIDPGQPVEDLSVEVAIEENREITHLHVPPLRNDLLTVVDLEASIADVVIRRPAVNRAVIRYAPDLQGQTEDSEQGLSGLFTVRYDIARKVDGGDLLVVNGYFVHFFAPDVNTAVPKDVVFVLDTSGSMSGVKIQQLKTAMLVILSDMTEGDRFTIMEFNSRVSFWQDNLVPVTNENMRKAFTYIKRLRATGMTNMNDALKTGFSFLSSQGSDLGSSMVVFLTDGVPSTGVTNSDAILRNALNANRKEMPIYGLSFGENADWQLVKKVSSQNNGVARRIYEDSDPAMQIQGFYKEVSTMLLTKVQARYLGDTVDPDSLTQSSFKNYFNGSELIIAGKLLDNTTQSLAVDMEANSAEGGLTLSLSSSALDLSTLMPSDLMSVEDLAEITEKMWAYLTLKETLKAQVGERDPLKKEELKQKATEMSLKYGFVTPVTSMVVTKPEEGDDVGALDEDDSDLQDDSTTASSGSGGLSRGGGGGGSGGGYSRGGGGYDPHFMMELSTLEFPLCFDVNAFAGDVFRLLRDPDLDLTVNIEIGEGLIKRNHPPKHGSPFRIFIFKVAVIYGDVVMEMTLNSVRVNEEHFTWNMAQTERIPGAWIMMSGNESVRFALDSGIEIDVKKGVEEDPQGAHFLSVEVENEQLLSKESDGLLGRFANKEITEIKQKQQGEKTVVRLMSRTGNEIHHGHAFLKTRRDPFFAHKKPCLNLNAAQSTRLLGHRNDVYKIPDLFYV